MPEHPTYIPDDFDAFWHETTAFAMGSPLDYRRQPSGREFEPGFQVDLLTFRGINGEQVQGWIAFEPGAHRQPAFLWIAPYGRESVLPNQYGTRKGFTSLSFNFHGESAFHQEKYVIGRGYFSEGLDDPETWIFRSMFQNAVIAARVLQAQSEVDEDKISSLGMSQGAGISIWLGAWVDFIRTVCADMPFLGAIKYALANSIYRYPLKEVTDFMDTLPLGRERVEYTLSYFDTMHMATRCKVPTLVSMGLKDPAVKPFQAEAVFDALPGVKELLRYDWGHDYHPEMIDNNRNWMLRHLG